MMQACLCRVRSWQLCSLLCACSAGEPHSVHICVRFSTCFMRHKHAVTKRAQLRCSTHHSFLGAFFCEVAGMCEYPYVEVSCLAHGCCNSRVMVCTIRSTLPSQTRVNSIVMPTKTQHKGQVLYSNKLLTSERKSPNVRD